MKAVMYRTEQIGSYTLLIALAAIWITCLLAAVTHMNIGLDISDTAYYILSSTDSEDVYSQSTLFGVVWRLISPFDGIVENRYLNLAVVQISFLFLSYSIITYLEIKNLISSGILVLFALGSSLHYLVTWLPDPSYNSLNLCIVATSWGAFFMLARASQQSGRSIMAWAFIIGVLLAAAVLVKATTAGILGVALLIGYFFVDHSRLSVRRLTALAAFALAGAIVFLAGTSAVGFTPLRIYRTMSNGFTAGMLIADPPLSVFAPIKEYIDAAGSASILHTWYPVAFSFLFSIVLFLRNRLPFIFRVTASILLSIAFAAITFSFDYELPRIAFINACFWFAYALATAALILVPIGTKQRLACVMFIMALSLGIYSYGTGNGWIRSFSSAPSFAWIAVAVVLAALPSRERLVLAPPAVTLLASSLTAAAIETEREPYRLNGPISAMTSAAKAGPQEEIIYVSPQLAEFYNGLAPIRHNINKLAERPILIDLSGRAPMAAYQIGARIPRTPWLLSSYAGSVPVFDFIVSHIPRKDISQAWILQSPEYEARFPDNILAKFGVNFPADYVEVAKVPLPYIGVAGHLYAPKAAMNAPSNAIAPDAGVLGKLQ